MESVTIEARPEPITIDRHRTAALVVDMQNDFGAKGGMFDRAGIDISVIRSVVQPTARACERCGRRRSPWSTSRWVTSRISLISARQIHHTA
jgi:ureidoacrylate peracid hydrolase